MLKFINRLWNTDFGGPASEQPSTSVSTTSYNDDPEFPGRSPSEVRRLREEAAQARRARDRQEHTTRKNADDDRVFTLAMLAAEEHRRAIAQFAADLSDTRLAIVRAHERATLHEAAKRQALELAQRNAVILTDGRSVYFTADGSRLYNDEDQQITDAGTLAEARQKHFLTATTHEDIVERRVAWNRATETSTQLHDALIGIDEIDARLATGDLTPDELRALREKSDQIIHALPAEAREEYDRLKAARQGDGAPSYRSADPAFEAAPLLKSDFRKAVTAPASATAADPANPNQQRVPVYRTAPDF